MPYFTVVNVIKSPGKMSKSADWSSLQISRDTRFGLKSGGHRNSRYERTAKQQKWRPYFVYIWKIRSPGVLC